MPRSSPPSWWEWVQRNLDARGWTPAELAREIRARYGYGPDESVIGRWKTKGARPSVESIRAVAGVFGRGDDIREVLIAAGWFTEEELRMHRQQLSWDTDLTTVPDDLLIAELRARLGKLSHRGRTATNGPGRTTVAPSRPGATRHTVAPGPKAEPASSPPSEDEEAGEVNDTQHEMC